jgi:hypothetical protein
MIFPRLPLHLMEFEGMWGQYFAIGSKKIIKNLFFYGRY